MKYARAVGAVEFQSTPSVGRATYCSESRSMARQQFQSTPSVGRATLQGAQKCAICKISIHALRGEGDARTKSCRNPPKNFNPRPPWGGRRRAADETFYLTKFQSTPSVGRATMNTAKDTFNYINFNPRPPWGGRPSALRSLALQSLISIHALRGEGDQQPLK